MIIFSNKRLLVPKWLNIMPGTFFFFYLFMLLMNQCIVLKKKMYIAISSVASLVTTPLLQPAVKWCLYELVQNISISCFQSGVNFPKFVHHDLNWNKCWHLQWPILHWVVYKLSLCELIHRWTNEQGQIEHLPLWTSLFHPTDIRCIGNMPAKHSEVLCAYVK